MNTNQTEPRPLPNTETKALISQPLAINLVLKRIDRITQTINWKRFTANWQYLTIFNIIQLQTLTFSPRDAGMQTVMRSVKKTRVTLFIADPGIVSVKMKIFLLMSDMSGESMEGQQSFISTSSEELMLL